MKIFLALLLMGAHAAQCQQIIVCDDTKEPLTLDPHKEFSEKNHTIVQQIYEGLVSLDENGNVQPALASSWQWADPLTLEFTLRQGVFFHNGEPFDSKVVRFSIERYLDPKTNFPALPFIATIDRVEPIGPWKVRIHTKMPDGLLINRLASFIVMVPPGYIADKGADILADHPIGTGPFVFKNWKKNEEIELSANPNYWRKGVPKFQSLRFRFLPAEDQLKALLAGRIDIATEIPGTATLGLQENPKTKVLKRETFYTIIGHFNTSRAPLNDLRVRKALSLGINRTDLIRYDVLGNGRIIASFSMPGEAGHNPSLRPYPYDPKEAKKLLKESGVSLPLHLKTLVAHSERTAHIIANQLKLIGVVLDLHPIPDSEVIAALHRETWDMGIVGTPDPMANTSFILSLLFYSGSPYSLHHDPTFDAMFEKALGTLDPAEQEKQLMALDQWVYDNALGMFTYQRIKTYGLRRNIEFVPSLTGMPHFDSAAVTTQDHPAAAP